MIRRPPRSTLDRSSAASDVYKRQSRHRLAYVNKMLENGTGADRQLAVFEKTKNLTEAVSYTHLRAHETVLDLVCRLLLEKKKSHTLGPFQNSRYKVTPNI